MAIGRPHPQRLATFLRQCLDEPGQQRQRGQGAEAEQEPVAGAPVEQLGQPAPQHGCQQGGEDHPHAHQAVGAVELGAAVAIPHQGAAHGATGPCAQSLDEAAHQQGRRRRDQLYGQGPQQKHHHPDEQHGAAPPLVRDGAIDELGEAVGDEIAGHHRL